MVPKSAIQVRSRFLNVFDNHANSEIDQLQLDTRQRDPKYELACVSSSQLPNKSASMEVLDISKKGEAKKIYSLGEVSGGKF